MKSGGNTGLGCKNGVSGYQDHFLVRLRRLKVEALHNR